MIKTDELRGVIAKNGYSQTDVAGMIGITPKTFYEKMKIGVFGSDEIQIMIDNLNIKDPMAIFLHTSNLKRYFKNATFIPKEEFGIQTRKERRDEKT